MSKVKTEYFKSVLDPYLAEFYYQKIKNEVNWQDGIYSQKHKVTTRKAYSISFPVTEIENEIFNLVNSILAKLGISGGVYGFYLNYYRNGNDWAPSHSHPDQIQLVISLGATRDLKVGSKIYSLNSGDVIKFGSSSHELIKDENITDGRISIPVFMEK